MEIFQNLYLISLSIKMKRNVCLVIFAGILVVSLPSVSAESASTNTNCTAYSHVLTGVQAYMVYTVSSLHSKSFSLYQLRSFNTIIFRINFIMQSRIWNNLVVNISLLLSFGNELSWICWYELSRTLWEYAL